jgi:hypothetical protein
MEVINASETSFTYDYTAVYPRRTTFSSILIIHTKSQCGYYETSDSLFRIKVNEYCHILGYDAVWLLFELMFRRNVSLQSYWKE